MFSFTYPRIVFKVYPLIFLYTILSQVSLDCFYPQTPLSV